MCWHVPEASCRVGALPGTDIDGDGAEEPSSRGGLAPVGADEVARLVGLGATVDAINVRHRSPVPL